MHLHMTAEKCLCFVQGMYYYGIEPALKGLFLDEAFCSLRRQAIAQGTGGLRGTKEFERINKDSENMLNNPDNGLIEIGADAFQPFTFATHSTQLVVVRWGSFYIDYLNVCILLIC